MQQLHESSYADHDHTPPHWQRLNYLPATPPVGERITLCPPRASAYEQLYRSWPAPPPKTSSAVQLLVRTAVGALEITKYTKKRIGISFGFVRPFGPALVLSHFSPWYPRDSRVHSHFSSPFPWDSRGLSHFSSRYPWDSRGLNHLTLGNSEVVGTHAVLPQPDPVLASLALPYERGRRFAAI